MVNTKLALPLLSVSSHQKFIDRYLKMAWSNMEAYSVWGFVIVNKRAAFHEFKWTDKNSQGLKEVVFHLPNIS